jgi:oxygen-independent coproporphyrinogen-3 oxidase
MRDDGLITIDGDRVAATEQGRPFIRAVCAVFDRYLQPVAARHAPAI